jgi:saccharopine dehydrogenase (NADP+, L-glutamate forming)
LKYIKTYGLSEIDTMLRGTLRNIGFCAAWDVLVQLGCCDDTYTLENISALTHAGFLNCFLDGRNQRDVLHKVCSAFHLSPDGDEIRRLRWSGFFNDELIGLENGTPAQITEHILNKKWKLREGDRDMIVMWHRFYYELEGKRKQVQASLVAIGQDSTYTAMAKTVGLPLAISAKLLMNGKVTSRGVTIPTRPEWYEPVLSELKSFGIELREEEL